MTGSATFSWTISTSGGGGGCSSPGQKLRNPGFETGTARRGRPAPVSSTTPPARPPTAGSWKAWLDGYGTTHTDTLTQSVTIPAGCTATFSFCLHIDTAETDHDRLRQADRQGRLDHPGHLLQRQQGHRVRARSRSTSPLAGTTSVSFSGAEDSSLQTSFVIDDTALTLS